MTLRILTEPAVEPVTLAELKAHCRVDDDITADDAYLTALIQTARELAEHLTNRALVRQQLELSLPGFPLAIELPMAPLISVESVEYIDSDGTEQTLVANTDYQLDSRREPALVLPAWNTAWPGTRTVPNAVTVTYWAGYAPDETVSPTDYRANVPNAIKQWIMIRAQQMYELREPLVIGAAVADLPRSYVDGMLDRYILSPIR